MEDRENGINRWRFEKRLGQRPRPTAELNRGSGAGWLRIAVMQLNRKSAIDSRKFLLLPLDRARWFGRDVIDDAVDAFYFIDDSGGDAS